MYQLKQTDVFEKWLSRLRDNAGKARIVARLDSCRLGTLGDTKSVGDGVRELRIHFGPGYRVYYAKRKNMILLLNFVAARSRPKRGTLLARKFCCMNWKVE